MNQPSSILVTGAGGFVGRALVPALIDRGHAVHALVRDPDDIFPDAINHVLPSVSAAGTKEILEECDTLIHLAWSTIPGESVGQPLLELEGNILPSIQLLQYVQHSPVSRLIFMSSGGAIGLADNALIPTGTPVSPSYYGAAKVSMEQFMLSLGIQFNKSVIVLRPTNLYGPNQPLVPGFGLIRTLVDCLIRERTVAIWGDGSARKDFLYIQDFVRLLSKIVENDSTNQRAILEVGSGRTHSIVEVLELLEDVAGKRIRRQHQSARRIDSRAPRPDLTPLFDWTDWRPTTSLTDGLTRVYDWAKEYYGAA